jgi:HDOD domain
VIDRALDSVVDRSGISPFAWWELRRLEDDRRFMSQKASFLDTVPVMSATVLGLDLLLHEPSIDFEMVSEIVRCDVGATIQILRLIDREFEFDADRPMRMRDCLASLDMSTWFETISARVFGCDHAHLAMTTLWRHSRLVAQYAQLIAESLDGIWPEDAYLVGLLHVVGDIQNILGGQNDSVEAGDDASLCAMEGLLSPHMLATIREVNDSPLSLSWKAILAAAHKLASEHTGFETSTPECCFSDIG